MDSLALLAETMYDPTGLCLGDICLTGRGVIGLITLAIGAVIVLPTLFRGGPRR